MADSSRPIRVLFLITDLGKGGAERFLIDLAWSLRSRPDVEITIGTLYDNDLYRPLTDGLPIEHLSFRPFSVRGHNSCPAYEELLARFRPDVVHTHRFLAEFLSSYCVSTDIAYICHGHDSMVQLVRPSLRTLLSRRAVLNALERQYLVRRKYMVVPTTFVANSHDTFDYFHRVLPWSMRNEIVLAPPGFSYDRFYAPAPQPPPAGARLRLINIGSFQEKKNQIFTVKIGQELNRRGVDFEIRLLGDGAWRALVDDAVRAAGLEDRILLHGNVLDVENWLHRSHVYLHTARYEPFGLVLLEAMAAGLPCVTLDGLGNRDIIEQGRNGFLIEREDASVFADRVVELASDQTLYRGMSTFSQQFAKQYDIATVASRFVELYKSRAELTNRRSPQATAQPMS